MMEAGICEALELYEHKEAGREHTCRQMCVSVTHACTKHVGWCLKAHGCTQRPDIINVDIKICSNTVFRLS